MRDIYFCSSLSPYLFLTISESKSLRFDFACSSPTEKPVITSGYILELYSVWFA